MLTLFNNLAMRTGCCTSLQARSSQSNKLELHFRPEDPYSHPAFGELRPCNNLLLKISREKPLDGHHAKASESIPETRKGNEAQSSQPKNDMVATAEEVEDCTPTDKEENLVADIVAHVPEAYCFDG